MSKAANRTRLAVLYAQQKGACHLCGGPMWLIWSRGAKIGGPDGMQANIDHLVPTACGGSNKMENLRASHYNCNQVKGMQNIEPLPLPCYEQKIAWSEPAW